MQKRNVVGRFLLFLSGIALLFILTWAMNSMTFSVEADLVSRMVLAFGILALFVGACALIVWGLVSFLQAAEGNDKIRSFHKFFEVEVPKTDEERTLLQSHIDERLRALATELRAAGEVEAQLLSKPKDAAPSAHASAVPAVRLAMLRQVKEQIELKGADFYFALSLAQQAKIEVKTDKEYMSAQ